MQIGRLLVRAEEVKTGKMVVGFVCACKSCRTPYEDEKYDKMRPLGMLTHPNEEYGNVRVYTDTIYFLNELEANAIINEGKDKNYRTIADRLRAMTDEEMAKDRVEVVPCFVDGEALPGMYEYRTSFGARFSTRKEAEERELEYLQIKIEK